MLIMRVDSNGCLYPDDCHDVNILTANHALPIEQNNYSLFPNPVESKLLVQYPSHQGNSEYMIVDFYGKQVAKGSILKSPQEINVIDLPSGLYVFCLYEKGELIRINRFVKIGSNN